MNSTELVVTRTISVTPEKVFDRWLDRTKPGGPWYGATRVIQNPEVDGLFYILLGHEGKQWAHYGRFIELSRPSKISHTWVSEATKGVETTVTLTLEPRGDETEVTLRHTGVPDDEMGRQHKDGWEWVLSTLDQALTGKKAGA